MSSVYLVGLNLCIHLFLKFEQITLEERIVHCSSQGDLFWYWLFYYNLVNSFFYICLLINEFAYVMDFLNCVSTDFFAL